MAVTDASSKAQPLDELPSSWQGYWTVSPALMASSGPKAAAVKAGILAMVKASTPLPLRQ